MSTVAWVVFAQLLTGGLGLVASMTAGRYSGLSDIDQSKVHYECLVTTPVSIGFVMPQIVRYLTHPQVLMEPLKDVRAWSLNEVGNNRVATLAARLGSLLGTRRVVSSDETKALETATPLSRALGVSLEVRSRMRENDRSATGFLPPPEFEAVADQFFAEPATSDGRGRTTPHCDRGRSLPGAPPRRGYSVRWARRGRHPAIVRIVGHRHRPPL